MANLASPLYALLKKETEWDWGPLEENSFDQLKSKLVSAPVLIIYDRSLPLTLCGYGLGAVLSHILPDNSERPVAFASRTLNGHEKQYSQLDKEGASIVFWTQQV